ncbi:MAG: hypothetical protein L6R42_008805 [Xanthoria sp. 1 TBL-2021]|nr:MAG: hypothetical protein L6R42_008805 [Xanthoria sp. 1 TBL-2021]
MSEDGRVDDVDATAGDTTTTAAGDNTVTAADNNTTNTPAADALGSGSPPQDDQIEQDATQADAQETSTQIPVPTRNIRDLFNPPRNIAGIRQRLFDVAEKIELRKDEFDLYWPYVDNVWVRQHRAGSDKTGLYKTDYYACRLQRPTYTPKAVDKPRPDGTPTRKKQIREGGKCHMKLKVVRYEGGYQSVTINQLGDKTQHLHDLDYMDKIKRTTVLMEIARSEVMSGYMPASVYTVMSEDEARLAASGGRHLNRNDVRNASQVWRQQHKDPLRVHEGYKYDHGNGIVRQDGALPLVHRVVNAEIVDPTLAYYAGLPPNTLRFPEELRPFLDPYLPRHDMTFTEDGLPHVTLTYATSLDSSLSLAPGIQTVLSGPHSKAMTHYLRSKHDAILVGVRTALADNPALNCRLEGVGGYGGLGWEGQPRPVIIDPGARWLLTPQTRVIRTVSEGKGKGPWIIIAPGFAMDPNRIEMLKYYGGKYLGLTDFDKRWRLRWEAILRALAAEGIRSVMIEGGGMVINELLRPEHSNLVSSVVVTVAPTYLGQGGVTVSPPPKLDAARRPQPAMRFRDVRWQSFGEDAVMCGRIPHVETPGAVPLQSSMPVTMAPPLRPVSFFNSSVDAQNGFQPRVPPSS